MAHSSRAVMLIDTLTIKSVVRQREPECLRRAWWRKTVYMTATRIQSTQRRTRDNAACKECLPDPLSPCAPTGQQTFSTRAFREDIANTNCNHHYIFDTVYKMLVLKNKTFCFQNAALSSASL